MFDVKKKTRDVSFDAQLREPRIVRRLDILRIKRNYGFSTCIHPNLFRRPNGICAYKFVRHKFVRSDTAVPRRTVTVDIHKYNMMCLNENLVRQIKSISVYTHTKDTTRLDHVHITTNSTRV